jgi:hypothetical protein
MPHVNWQCSVRQTFSLTHSRLTPSIKGRRVWGAMKTTVFNELYQFVSATEAALRLQHGLEIWTGADAEVAPPPPALDQWAEQLSYIPPEDVQERILARGTAFIRIGYEGAGPICLDLYKVEVTDPSLPDGGKADARWLMLQQRSQFPELLDTKFGAFEPYDDTLVEDLAFTNPEKDPMCALLHIRIPIDDGAVVVVLADQYRWRVSTGGCPAFRGIWVTARC